MAHPNWRRSIPPGWNPKQSPRRPLNVHTASRDADTAKLSRVPHSSDTVAVTWTSWQLASGEGGHPEIGPPPVRIIRLGERTFGHSVRAPTAFESGADRSAQVPDRFQYRAFARAQGHEQCLVSDRPTPQIGGEVGVAGRIVLGDRLDESASPDVRSRGR